MQHGDGVWLRSLNRNGSAWWACQGPSCMASSICPADGDIDADGVALRPFEGLCFASVFSLRRSGGVAGGPIPVGSTVWLQQKATGGWLNCPLGRSCGSDGMCGGGIQEPAQGWGAALLRAETNPACSGQSFELLVSGRDADDGGLGVAAVQACYASSELADHDCHGAIDGSLRSWWAPFAADEAWMRLVASDERDERDWQRVGCSPALCRGQPSPIA